jgi:hypothetical protein
MAATVASESWISENPVWEVRCRNGVYVPVGTQEINLTRRQIMKRIANQFTYPAALAVASVLLAFMVVSSATPSIAASHGASKTDRVETRIKELHAKLMITPEQEELWNNVTQVCGTMQKRWRRSSRQGPKNRAP